MQGSHAERKDQRQDSGQDERNHAQHEAIEKACLFPFRASGRPRPSVQSHTESALDEVIVHHVHEGRIQSVGAVRKGIQELKNAGIEPVQGKTPRTHPLSAPASFAAGF